MTLYMGKEAFGSHEVLKVGTPVNNQDKTITENGTYTADEGYTGLGTVEVNVEGIRPTGTKTITENGTYDVTEFASAEVNVEGGPTKDGKALITNQSVTLPDFAVYSESSYGNLYVPYEFFDSLNDYDDNVNAFTDVYFAPNRESEKHEAYISGTFDRYIKEYPNEVRLDVLSNFDIDNGILAVYEVLFKDHFDSPSAETIMDLVGIHDGCFEWYGYYDDNSSGTYYSRDNITFYEDIDCSQYAFKYERTFSSNEQYYLVSDITHLGDGILEVSLDSLGSVYIKLNEGLTAANLVYLEPECIHNYLITDLNYLSKTFSRNADYFTCDEYPSLSIYVTNNTPMLDGEYMVAPEISNMSTEEAYFYFDTILNKQETFAYPEQLILEAPLNSTLGPRAFYHAFERQIYYVDETGQEKFQTEPVRYKNIEIRGVVDTATGALSYMCHNNRYIETFSMPDLKTLELANINSAFRGASKIKEINFDSLVRVQNQESSYEYNGFYLFAPPSGSCTTNMPNLEEIKCLNTYPYDRGSTLNLGNKLRVIDGYFLGYFNCSNLTEENFANVQVLSGNYPLLRVFRGKPGILINLDNVSVIGDKALSGMYAGTTVTELPDEAYRAVDLSYLASGCVNLTTIDNTKLNSTKGNLTSSFSGCVSLTSLDLSTFKPTGSANISSAFSGCSNLVSVDLSGIKAIHSWNSAFDNCSKLTNINFSSLESLTADVLISSYAPFNDCSSLETITFNKLKTFSSSWSDSPFDSAFRGCSKLKDLSFPALTSTSFNVSNYHSPFYDMLYDLTGCTVHFPSNLSQTFGNHRDFTSGFGGRNTVVLFDLPVTE